MKSDFFFKHKSLRSLYGIHNFFKTAPFVFNRINVDEMKWNDGVRLKGSALQRERQVKQQQHVNPDFPCLADSCRGRPAKPNQPFLMQQRHKPPRPTHRSLEEDDVITACAVNSEFHLAHNKPLILKLSPPFRTITLSRRACRMMIITLTPLRKH